MKKVAVFILSVLLIGCSDKDNLQSNKTIKSIFNQQEIEDSRGTRYMIIGQITWP